jgi:hypothetical protein
VKARQAAKPTSIAAFAAQRQLLQQWHSPPLRRAQAAGQGGAVQAAAANALHACSRIEMQAQMRA